MPGKIFSVFWLYGYRAGIAVDWVIACRPDKCDVMVLCCGSAVLNSIPDDVAINIG